MPAEMLPPITDQLFTSVNVASVGIATAAVNVAANALYKISNKKLPPQKTAFGAALLIAYIVVYKSSNPLWYDWVLAFFNACLLYCSALGMNEMGSVALSPSGKGFAKTEGFMKSWLKQ